MNGWIHTRRGVTLVEGTLPSIARGLKSLTAELKRYNDAREADAKPEEPVTSNGMPTPEHPAGIHLMGVSGKTYEGGCECATCRCGCSGVTSLRAVPRYGRRRDPDEPAKTRQ